MTEEATEDTFEYPFAKCHTVVTGEFEKADVIAAIMRTGGNLAAMGRLLAKPRNAVKAYIDKQQDLVLLLADQREGFLDEIEAKAMNAALTGDTTNQRFFLQTLGKARGYTTKSDINANVSADAGLAALLERVAKEGKSLVETKDV